MLAEGRTGPVPGAEGQNLLQVEARGPVLSFALDGKVVSRLEDTAYTAGVAGFYVEILDAPRVHVHFDTIDLRGAQAIPPASPARATTGTPAPATPSPGSSGSPTPSVQEAGTCEVTAWALNIRRGPGTLFLPDTAVLRGATLGAISRSADAMWIWVRVPVTGQTGWVSSRYVACDIDVATLPVEGI